MSTGFKHHSEINHEKWDALVRNDTNGSIFSTSHYLNATCDNWFAFTNNECSFGVPIGVKQKLGISNVYPPFFHRYSEVLNEKEIDINLFEQELNAQFKTGVFHLKQDRLTYPEKEEFIYQVLEPSTYKLKSQAKRMLNKFDKSSYELLFDNSLKNDVLLLVKTELSKKMDLYASKSANALDSLVSDLPEPIELITVGLKDQDQLVGGLFGLKYKNTILYLKGTTTEVAKEQGGMYGLMNALIHRAIDNELLFDFGGSRVEGVRFFNRRFNAQDKTYFCYQWDHTPAWYKTLKRINQWRKK